MHLVMGLGDATSSGGHDHATPHWVLRCILCGGSAQATFLGVSEATPSGARLCNLVEETLSSWALQSSFVGGSAYASHLGLCIATSSGALPTQYFVGSAKQPSRGLCPRNLPRSV